MDLNKIIHDAIEERITEDFVKQEVDKRVESLVTNVIEEQMRSYGDISKAISAAVKESIQVKDLDLPNYGAMVSTMVKNKIEELVHPLIAGKLANDMEELLTLAPKTVKLSRIVEDMMKESAAYEDGDTGDLVTCIVETNDYGSTWIHLDPNQNYPASEKYSCEIRFMLSSDSTIFTGTVSGQDFGNANRGRSSSHAIRFGVLRGIEQRIMSYYACGTVIEVDEDEVSTYRDYD